MISATVVVTSRNRKDDLRACLQSALQQQPPPEVLVVDDGSTDGTAEMVRTEFPSVVLISHAESKGYICRRNEAARRAQGDVIVSLDDDAAFSAAGIVDQAVRLFDREGIGAVAIPYIDVNQGPTVNQRAPDSDKVYVTDKFIGTAHAVKRDLFVSLGGYREELFHQGEESDYCIRLIAAGYAVRIGSGDCIHHFESPKRDFRRMDHFGPRNAVLFVWQNVPFPFVAIYLPVTMVRLVLHTFSPLRLWIRMGGVISGMAACLRVTREPVPSQAFAVWRRLRAAQPPLAFDDVADQLRAMRS